MIVRIAVSPRNTMLDALTTLVDGGSVEFYTAPMPANGDAAVGAATLLATLTLANPAADFADAGVATFNSIAEDSGADTDGTPAWARFYDSADNPVFDVDVGDEESDAAIKFNTVDWHEGGPVRLPSFSMTIPASFSL